MKSFKEYVAESVEQEDSFSHEFEIPAHNRNFLQKKIDKLNKIAAKINAAPIKMTWGNKFSRKIKEETRDEPAQYMDFIPVTVEGESPKLNGWSFAGKLEPMEGTNEVLAKTAPGAKQLPKKYQHVDHIECEHCKINRFRKESFIVKKGSTYKQVGRSCLKDFLGHADPKQVAAYAEALYDIDALISEASDDKEGGGRIYPMVSTIKVVAKALVEIKKNGFKSKQYSDYPTSDALYAAFFPPKGRSDDERKATFISHTNEDEESAKKILDYVNDKWSNSKSEFENNSAKIMKTDVIPTKYFGYVAAAVNSYIKTVDAESAKKAVKSDVTDEHIGQIDEKHKIAATVLTSHVYQGQSHSYYDSGLKAIVMFKTETGHIVKMFTSNTTMQTGDKVVISGKIGRHEIETFDKSPFKGMKITIMAPGSRVKFVDDN